MPSERARVSGADGHPHLGIVDVVLGVHRPRPRRHGVMTAGAGLAVCTLMWLAAPRLERERGPGPQVAARVPIEISLDEAVAPPAPAPSTRVPEPARAPAPVHRTPVRAPSRVEANAPPAPAAPAAAGEPPPGPPLDMTDETLVVGSARGYAGGATAARGTGTTPGQGRGPSGNAAAGAASGGGGGSKSVGGQSAPVFLASQSWSCPWPSEAEPLPINEETVVIRVVVLPTGMAESVVLVSDPGHGFGQAAAGCAMRTAFVPARTAGGAPVRATSAPIRVRFTRQ